MSPSVREMPEEVSEVSTVPPPASTAQALGMLRSAMGYLSAADATAMAAETQVECLQVLKQINSMGTAARASILDGVHLRPGLLGGRGLQPAGVADQPHPGSQRRCGRLHRVGSCAAAHPQVAVALAAGEVSESIARTICQWTDKLPADCRATADKILTGAAGPGWTCET